MDFNETSTKVILLIIVLFTGLLITGAVILSSQPPAAAPTADIKNVKMDGDPSIGQASAPVTIAFWSDYQCPLCKAFELNTLPQMLKDYVDTGKVKIVFLDFAFLGNDSTTAALYGRSVWKLYPSRYLDWRTAMYTAQDQEGDKGFGNAVTIDTLDATIGGLDAAKIAADVKANTNTYQAAIDADRVEVTKAGITGTPSFVIGTQLIVGNQPYTILKAAIDPLVK
jgi:protein-disulfide isomerase